MQEAVCGLHARPLFWVCIWQPVKNNTGNCSLDLQCLLREDCFYRTWKRIAPTRKLVQYWNFNIRGLVFNIEDSLCIVHSWNFSKVIVLQFPVLLQRDRTTAMFSFHWITRETIGEVTFCLLRPTAVTRNQHFTTDCMLLNVCSRSVTVSLVHTLLGVIGSGVYACT